MLQELQAYLQDYDEEKAENKKRWKVLTREEEDDILSLLKDSCPWSDKNIFEGTRQDRSVMQATVETVRQTK